jgi:uncharacterized protein (UPF0335 family)
MTDQLFDDDGDLRHDNSTNETSTESVAHDQLKAFVERIERMEEEKSAIAADIRDIYAEAKGNGFDTKVLRTLIKRRKMDASERAEQDAILELYEGVFA